MSCAQAFTIGVMTALAVQWRTRPWLQRFLDATICLACLFWRQPNLPLLLPSFALAYTVWTTLPGSSKNLNLPSHSKFMRQLKLVQSVEKQDECGVCWNDNQELAELPCGHICCRRCLQLMGDNFQTACPFCRRPLFCRYDRAVYVLTKGGMMCTTLNALFSLAQFVLEIRRARYLDAILPLGTLCGLGGFLAYTSALYRYFDENWWRGAPATTGSNGWSLQAALSACSTGAFLLWQTFWKTNWLVLQASES